MPDSIKAQQRFEAGNARVSVYDTAATAGAAAAAQAVGIIRSAIAREGRARVIVATGNSQIPLIEALVRHDVDWTACELFHMDEYVGLTADHPSSFRHWIKTRLEDKVHPRITHYIEGDAQNLSSEMVRYTGLLEEAPIDLAFVGFGENGHIAFNDPHVADFNDPAMLKIVELDDACRRQQAGEGHFRNLDAVPELAVTITCSGLFRAKQWICCVPEWRKAEAVRCALEGLIRETCPASLVRNHPDAQVYLDIASASRLSLR